MAPFFCCGLGYSVGHHHTTVWMSTVLDTQKSLREIFKRQASVILDDIYQGNVIYIYLKYQGNVMLLDNSMRNREG